jgi:4a-hydroxytetrahydrobiopterin dehydratase
MTDLTKQKCVPCEGNAMPLNQIEAEVMLKNIEDWVLAFDSKSISRKFIFSDFKRALAFVNKVGEIAEVEQHHPDIHLVDYKFVEVVLSTHAIDGLSQNDFIVAAKINEL